MNSEFTFGVKHSIYNYNLKTRCSEMGLTFEELAKEVGCSYQYISQICCFRVSPSIELVLKIVNVLDTTIEYIFPKELMKFKKQGTLPLTLITMKQAKLMGYLPNNEYLITDGGVSIIEDTCDLKKHIDECLNTLSDRERVIIECRFGLKDDIPKTLEEVGTHFNITSTRIQQIEDKALRKLRHPSISRKLKTYL